jgi:phosphoribosylformylglycinamidine synthase
VKATPVLVLRAAGTNCDAEAVHAFGKAGGLVEERRLAEVVEKPALLREAAILVFPGGFTFGDDVASGAVFAVKLRARLLPELLRAVENGRLVLGVCNGFQILVRAGLLPALTGPGVAGEATLGFNDSARFEDRWVTLEGTSDRCPWVRKGDLIDCPVAHGEGKFVPRDDGVLRRLREGDQVVVRYRMPDRADDGIFEPGRPAPGTYPFNPNGSVDDIAGICDPTGRVFGLMPHPERNALPWHHPGAAGRPRPERAGSGLRVFENAVRWAREHA